jgi:hypothetical protein
MQRRWFPYLLSGMLCLLLLSSAALAQNSQANWGNFRNRPANKTTNNQSNRTSRKGTWGTRTTSRANQGGFGKLGTRTRVSGSRSGPVYRNNNGGYYGNSNYGQGGNWRDRDGDGDRDYWRHRHYRHHRRHHDDDDDGRWRNGRWNGGTPPGWQHGRKVGWGNSDLPPGQAKKQGWQ